ncbi:MAG: hypothetical protein OQK11_10700 [Thiovulaceae bacterium]|nr:hypothetical protein [Sulfurimonadaceae bacterium]
MIKIILLFLLPLSIYASKILSYNIYDRTDRADIMITFDVPYEGTIKKIRTNSKIIIKLQDASIESAKLKQISSEYIKTLAITPLANYVQLVASVSDNITLTASKTADAYGLRLRFQKEISANKQTTSQVTSVKSPISHLPTKKTDDITQSYYIVIAILIVGIIILFIVKKKVTPRNTMHNQTKSNNLQKTDIPLEKISDHGNSEVSIRFQKNIDENNSVVMLDFMDQSYLVMMGSNNVLLDRFRDEKPASQEEFNMILQDHQQMLENFLNEQNEPGVKSYSQKASSISYDV